MPTILVPSFCILRHDRVNGLQNKSYTLSSSVSDAWSTRIWLVRSHAFMSEKENSMGLKFGE